MQIPTLPDRIDPWQLAAGSGRLDGELKLAALPRLAALLEHADGTVNVALAAGIDEQGLRFVEGSLQTEVELICQRCLGPLRLPLKVAVSLALVRAEADAARLPEQREPLLAAGADLAVADLVEDELLLALPQIPRHRDVCECEAAGYYTPPSGPALDAGQPRAFTALASLLQDFKRSN
ncbi:MAG: DUF177 domain-containing protein [Candidatus Competibacteraceae bacterium]|nr:MAG: DUF177 domain-containing protein [Candidatus Competibacteraceae bacterium]